MGGDGERRPLSPSLSARPQTHRVQGRLDVPDGLRAEEVPARGVGGRDGVLEALRARGVGGGPSVREGQRTGAGGISVLRGGPRHARGRATGGRACPWRAAP
jgi:hypothetical protein